MGLALPGLTPHRLSGALTCRWSRNSLRQARQIGAPLQPDSFVESGVRGMISRPVNLCSVPSGR